MSSYFDNGSFMSDTDQTDDLNQTQYNSHPSTVFYTRGIKLVVKTYRDRVWLHFYNRVCFSERISLTLEEFISIFSKSKELNEGENKIIGEEADLLSIEITKYFSIEISKSDDKLTYLFKKVPYKKGGTNTIKRLPLRFDQFQHILDLKVEIFKFTDYLENKVETDFRNELYKNSNPKV